MTVKYKFSQKLMSVFVCIALLMTYLPLSAITAGAATPLNGVSKVTDTPTVNGWKNVFTENSTENAGGVWADKSVFSTAEAYLNATDENETSNQSYYLNMNDPNNFLVSLSAIASNKQVTGYSTIPTDTVFVLDMSSSMYRSNSIGDLAEATNSAIQELTSLNRNNRISVILYSGSGYTTVLLPLDKYTPNSQNNFITHNGTNNRTATSITVLDGVENSSGTDVGRTEGYHTGTFTQDGIYAGMKQLLAADSVVTEGIQAGVERMPIMVVMTDGAPSHSTSVFSGNDSAQTSLTRNNGSNDYDACDFVQFVNQLTAAYAKYKVETEYTGHDMLLYTLGLGVTDADVPTLQPETSNSTIVGYWNSFLNGSTVTERCSANLNRSVNPNAAANAAFMTALESADGERYRYYSDGYYHSDIGGLEAAFDAIVDEIILQSKYYPTYVEGSNINYGGYLSMVDTLGKYMEVKDMKHVQIGSQPFYGRNAARELSSITSLNNLNEIQTNLVKAVTDRLNVDENTALQVILASQTYNNLYYNDTDDFNNAICWYGKYSDAVKGAEYVGVWNGNGDSNVPSEANCKIQSYYFYGAGEATDGQIRVGDMRYIEVDVVTFIKTNETKVRVRIPASLIPIITYEVELNGETLDSNVEDITLTGADAPMRLIYEVGLKDTINSLNVGEMAADAYNPTTDAYEFYTNKWDYNGEYGSINIGVTPPQVVGNSYAYFEPSAENEYLYYQNDTPVYVKDGDDYIEYVGSAHPMNVENTTFYGQRFYYTKPAVGRTSEPIITYHEFDEAHLEHIVQAQGSSTSWIIPRGSHFKGNGDTVSFYKDNDEPSSADGGPTGTYKTSSTYYITHSFENQTSVYNMQVALGNNGKLTIEAEQGVRLQKIVPDNSGLDADTEYEFTIAPAEGNSVTLSGNYNLYLVDAIDDDGTAGAADNGNVTASENSLTVTIKGNQTLYIAGLPAGKYTVTEKLGASYIVSAIGATTTNSNSTTVAVENNKFTTTSFTNIARGTGDLTVSKDVIHPYGAAYTVPDDLTFEMTVSLSLNGAPISGDFDAIQTKDSSVTKITADSNGKFKVNLYSGDEIEIIGLPEGTVAMVVETAKEGFAPTYWENGVVDGEVDGQVTIAENHTSSVLVVNDYTPDEIDNPIISLTVDKSLSGREWASSDNFDFELQRWDGAKWVKIGSTKTINGSMTEKKLDFTAEIKSEKYSNIGTYYYRVVEIKPEPHGILGIHYDKALHGFVVEVADKDMDGQLEINKVRRGSTTQDTKVQISGDSENGYTVSADFENIYNVEGTKATIEVHKKVENPSGSPYAILNGFQFELYQVDSDGQNPVSLAEQYPFEETTTTGTTRRTIPYNTSGTFYYAIKEVNGGKAGWNYSTETKYVTVVVAPEGEGTDAALVATVYSGLGTSGEGSITGIVSFTNIYNPTPASLNLDVKKTLNGRDMAANEFEFQIAPYNNDFNSNPIVISSGKLSENLTAKNIAADKGESSNVTFPTMYFDKVGTYFYNVSEIPTDKDGVETDDNIYRVVVTVTDDKNGKLSASYQVYNVAGTEIEFVNTYTPDPITNAISGGKELVGRNLRNQEFTFVLTESDENGVAKTNARTWTAQNNVTGTNTGTFTFPEISYDTAGTYYYAVTEQKGADGHGITYSAEKYVVKVVVTYSDVTGEFAADSSIVKISEANSPAVDEITFTNKYEVADTEIDIVGNKILAGNRTLIANEFNFELWEANADWNPTGRIGEFVSNDANGKFIFENIPLTKAATYRFIVREIIPEETEKIKGVTYDESIFRVTVVVTDDGNGKLEYLTPTITRVVVDNEISASAIVFYNRYVADDVILTIGGEKELTGRTLVEGEFTFNLYEADENFVIDEGVDVKKAKNKADRTFTFEDLTFSEIGTYYYVVEEDSSDKLERVKYDDTKYYITVTVTDDTENGKLVAESVIKTSPNATENADSIVFTNKYTPKPTDISVDINIDKKVENKGSEKITAEGFEFALQKEGDATPTTVKTDKDGKAKFELGFTEDDIGNTYNYTLTEVDGGKANVTYSTVKYDIAITVSLDENNKLVASITQNTVAVESVVAEFVNEYDYTPSTPPTPPEEVPKSPQTGDTSNLTLWFALLFVSGMGIVATTTMGRKKKSQDKIK